MNNKISQRLTKMVRNFVVLVLAGLIIYQPAFAAHIPITIMETDGTPSIANIRKIQVGSNKIQDLGNGVLGLNLNGTAANVAGQNGMIQYNLDNGFAAEAAFSYNSATNVMSVDGSTFGSAVSIASTLAVTGTSNLGVVNAGNTAITGTLSVSSTSSLAGVTAGNTAITGTFGVIGASTLNGQTTIQDNLTVTGNTTVGGTLGVTGAATFSSSASIDGMTMIKKDQETPGSSLTNYGRLYVKADGNLYYLAAGSTSEFKVNNSNNTVAGSNTELQFNNSGAFGADSDLTFIAADGELHVNGSTFGEDVSILGALAAGNTQITGTFGVLGASTLNGATTVQDNLTVTGSTTLAALSATNGTFSGTVQANLVNGSSLTGDALTITGLSSFTGNLGVVGAVTLNGATAVQDTFSVSGSSTFSGATQVNNTFGVVGAVTLNGATTVQDDFTVTGSSSFAAVSAGNTAITGTLGVVGAVTLNGATAVQDNLTVSGTSALTGNVTFSGVQILQEQTDSPSASSGFGKLYAKAGGLYYLTGGGTETLLSDGNNTSAISTKSANYSIVTTDHTILVNASGGARTMTLPTAVGNSGKMFVIKKIDPQANLVTVQAQEGEDIDGAADYKLNLQYEAIKVQSDGSDWYIL